MYFVYARPPGRQPTHKSQLQYIYIYIYIYIFIYTEDLRQKSLQLAHTVCVFCTYLTIINTFRDFVLCGERN